MPAKNDPLHDQLAAARRAQILAAATQVFAEKGFHNTTIRQVASTAGLADGTIYIYFKNKTDLLLGIMAQLNRSDERPQDFAQSTEMTARDFFGLYLRQRFAELDAEFQTLRAILPDILNNAELRATYLTQIVTPTLDLSEPFFQQWIEQGVIKADPLKPHNVALTVRVVSSMVLGLLVLRMLGDPAVEQQWQALPDVISQMLLGE